MTRVLPVVVVAVLALLFALVLVRGKDPALQPSALIGRAAPGDFEYGGAPVLVNVFASWCVSCAAEQDVLGLAAQSGVTVYGLAYKDKQDALDAWLARHGNPFAKIVMDAEGARALDWGITGVPETFVIDAGGIVRHRVAGPVTPEIFADEIAPLLAEARQ